MARFFAEVEQRSGLAKPGMMGYILTTLTYMLNTGQWPPPPPAPACPVPSKARRAHTAPSRRAQPRCSTAATRSSSTSRPRSRGVSSRAGRGQVKGAPAARDALPLPPRARAPGLEHTQPPARPAAVRARPARASCTRRAPPASPV
jgi:hypothetical protein